VCVLDAEEIIDNRIDTFGSIGALSMRASAVGVIGVGLVLKKFWSGIWNRRSLQRSNLIALRQGAVGKL
jgi:hypothetical protein